MKPRLPLIAILLCFLFLSSFNSSYNVDQETGAIDESSRIIESPNIQAYEDYGQIVIAGDDNLTAWGFPGSGSVGEPFRIEGYNFTLNGTAISVTNVSLHLLITGCWIQSAGDKTGNGIYFENVTSGRIENCTIKNKTYGIHLFESDSCTIFDIEVTGTSTYGVFFDTSIDCEIDGSYIHHISNMGIMDEATRTIISNTIIQNAVVNGIFAMGTNITITGCDISYSSQWGIRNEAWYGIISNNEIFYNLNDGIYDRTARYNTFSNNRIFGNGWSGIWAYVSRYETYIGNTIFNNQIGFSQSSSFSGNSDFFANSVGWNHVENALHDGDNPNNYDDGVSIGNAWNDYSGIGTYSITGDWGGVDHYPTILNDSTAPSIVSGPSDVFMSDIETKTVSWDLIPELYPDTYTVTLNGDDTITKWEGEDIEVVLEGLAPGTYLCELFVKDCAGNNATDSFSIDVYGFAIDNPADIVIEKGYSGNFIEWFATSGNQDDYEIYVNGSLILTAAWDSWNITYNVDDLPSGLNEVEIRVYNASGGYLSDFVMVYVVDTIRPVINGLGLYYLEKDSLLTLEWTMEDLNPDRFMLLKNGSSILNATWEYPIFSYEIVGSEIGKWNYTLVVIDQGGNIATDTAIVVVRETSPTTTTGATTTTTTSTSTTTNNTQLAQLENQLYVQLLVIEGIGALTIISLLFNVLVFRKIGKKGKK